MRVVVDTNILFSAILFPRLILRGRFSRSVILTFWFGVPNIPISEDMGFMACYDNLGKLLHEPGFSRQGTMPN